MNHRQIIFQGVIVAVLLAALGITQAVTAAEPSATVIAKIDRDNDKTLDWNEVQGAASARFEKLNKDAGATVDAKEVKGVIGAAEFKAADPDNDGTLSKEEYLALAKKLFNQTDEDHDGTLDAKELGSKVGHRLKLLIDG